MRERERRLILLFTVLTLNFKQLFTNLYQISQQNLKFKINNKKKTANTFNLMNENCSLLFNYLLLLFFSSLSLLYSRNSSHDLLLLIALSMVHFI